MGVDTGQGATITFVTSGFTANVMSISAFSTTRAEVETTHLGTVGNKTYVPSDLVDLGETTFEIQVDPDTSLPYAAAEVVRVTFPLGAGGITAAKWEAQGFVKSYGAVEITSEGLHTATVGVKHSGGITITAEV